MGPKGPRHLGDVGCGAWRVSTIPRSVAANDQLAGLRFLGVHNPAVLPTFNSNVVITEAIPQGGLDGPKGPVNAQIPAAAARSEGASTGGGDR